MSSRKWSLVAITSCICLSSSVFAQPQQSDTRSLTLIEALREAEKASPRLKSAQYLQQASHEQVRSAQSGYLPSLDAAAIASDGSPGAASLLGVDANYGASQRIGEGAALLLKQTIYDFGRTQSAVESAKINENLQSQAMGLAQADVDIQVLRSYLDCAFLKSEAADARFTAEQAKVIARETNRYVQSGQRSVIERYLVDQQAEEANRLNAQLLTQAQVVEERLAIELGRPQGQTVMCGELDSIGADIARLSGTGTSPVLLVSESQTQLAQSRLNLAKAQERPVLLGLVTGGYFNSTHTDQLWNYSAGVGITLPLFEGFRLQSDIARYAAESSAQEASLESARQSVSDANSRYEEQIRSMQVALEALAHERELATKAFQLAQKRYFGLQGTMVDLREALRNLDRVNLATEEAKRNLLVAQGSQGLFNGARP